METHQSLPNDQSDLRKQQEAMWELFTSECTYFLDHLLVLKMVRLHLILEAVGKQSILWGLIFILFQKQNKHKRKRSYFSHLCWEGVKILFIVHFCSCTTWLFLRSSLTHILSRLDEPPSLQTSNPLALFTSVFTHSLIQRANNHPRGSPFIQSLLPSSLALLLFHK